MTIEIKKTKPGLRITLDVRYDLAENESIEFVQKYLQSSVDTIVGDGFLTAHHNIDSEVEDYATKVQLLDIQNSSYTTYQELALGNAIAHFLSDWPDDLSNQEILEALSEDEDGDLGGITPWEPFEMYEGCTLVRHIEGLADSYLQAFRLIQSTSMVDSGEDI